MSTAISENKFTMGLFDLLTGRFRSLLLLAGLFVMASTAIAQDRLPDLMPMVVNANQGTVEIRNIGQQASKPSQVFIVCSRFGVGSSTTSCATGLNLPNYIKKWNALTYDIPALQSGARYQIRMFAAGALPRSPGHYGMTITADPLKRITESDETNNYTRLDTTIKSPPGSLRLVVLDDGDTGGVITFHYAVTKHGGKRSIASGDSDVSSQIINLPPGRYDLRVVRTHIFYAGFYGLKKYYSNVEAIQRDLRGRVLGPEQEKVLEGIRIQAGQMIEEHLVFKHIEAGFLRLSMKSDGKLTKTWMGIRPSGLSSDLFDFNEPFIFDAPLMVPLAPGRYRIHIEPQSEGYKGNGYGKKEFSVEIRPGKTLSRTLAFTSQQKGVLKLTVLVNGSRKKGDIRLRKAGSHAKFPYSSSAQASYNMVSNKVELLPGRYDVSVRPLEACLSPGGVDVFHGGVTGPNVRFRMIKGVEPVILPDIIIKPGKTLQKKVNFTSNSHDVQVCL